MSTHVYREGGVEKIQNSVYVECERPLRVGTLLENTRLEKTRSFLNLRVLARKTRKQNNSDSTRLVLEGRVSSFSGNARKNSFNSMGESRRETPIEIDLRYFRLSAV